MACRLNASGVCRLELFRTTTKCTADSLFSAVAELLVQRAVTQAVIQHGAYVLDNVLSEFHIIV